MGKSTKKSCSIDALLTGLTGISRQAASAQSICPFCKEPITSFRDALSSKEYGISGLCQRCQDIVFDA